MKALDSKVNIIPIIAKADTITKAELHKFKLKVCISFSSVAYMRAFLIHISNSIIFHEYSFCHYPFQYLFSQHHLFIFASLDIYPYHFSFNTSPFNIYPFPLLLSTFLFSFHHSSRNHISLHSPDHWRIGNKLC